MARAPLRYRPDTWTRQLDDALMSLRSRRVTDERIVQILRRDLAAVSRRVDHLRSEGHHVARRTPSDRATPRRRPEHVGPLTTAEVEVLATLRREGLSIGAVAARLGRAYGPVAAADREIVRP